MNDTPSEYEIALATIPAPEASDLDVDEERLIRRETTMALLANLTARAKNPDALGKSVMAKAFLLGVSPLKSQRELAEWCDVSEARISAVLSLLRKKAP